MAYKLPNIATPEKLLETINGIGASLEDSYQFLCATRTLLPFSLIITDNVLTGVNGNPAAVTLPNTLTGVSAKALKYTNIATITFDGATPPTFGADWSPSTLISIIVPSGAKTAYDTALPSMTSIISEASSGAFPLTTEWNSDGGIFFADAEPALGLIANNYYRINYAVNDTQYTGWGKAVDVGDGVLALTTYSGAGAQCSILDGANAITGQPIDGFSVVVQWQSGLSSTDSVVVTGYEELSSPVYVSLPSNITFDNDGYSTTVQGSIWPFVATDEKQYTVLYASGGNSLTGYAKVRTTIYGDEVIYLDVYSDSGYTTKVFSLYNDVQSFSCDANCELALRGTTITITSITEV